MMRRSLPVIALLLATAACQGAEQESDTVQMSDNMSEAASDSSLAPAPSELPSSSGRAGFEASPDVRPTAAPGVAFDYRYAFRLEPDRVAEAQQEHQRICERYTVNRCRITGMVYRRASEDD